MASALVLQATWLSHSCGFFFALARAQSQPNRTRLGALANHVGMRTTGRRSAPGAGAAGTLVTARECRRTGAGGGTGTANITGKVASELALCSSIGAAYQLLLNCAPPGKWKGNGLGRCLSLQSELIYI